MDAKLEQKALLPCPFCGNDVQDDEGCFQVSGFKPPSTPVYAVRCGNPRCNAETSAESREQAITAWNTRALTQAQPGWRVVPVETEELLSAQTDELLALYRYGYAPEGFALVPAEPTSHMGDIGGIWVRNSPGRAVTEGDICRAMNVYRAMLAAAPAPQQGVGA